MYSFSTLRLQRPCKALRARVQYLGCQVWASGQAVNEHQGSTELLEMTDDQAKGSTGLHEVADVGIEAPVSTEDEAFLGAHEWRAGGNSVRKKLLTAGRLWVLGSEIILRLLLVYGAHVTEVVLVKLYLSRDFGQT